MLSNWCGIMLRKAVINNIKSGVYSKKALSTMTKLNVDDFKQNDEAVEIGNERVNVWKDAPFKRTVNAYGRQYVAYNTVFGNENNWNIKLPFNEYVNKENSRILDIGTGYGLYGLEAALLGINVVVTDINPHIVDNVIENAKDKGVLDKFDDILVSDVFDELLKDNVYENKYKHSFDTIIWNHPWVFKNESDINDIMNDEYGYLKIGVGDPQYKSLQKYFKDAHKFLKNGKKSKFYIIISFEHGNKQAFDYYADSFNIKYKIYSTAYVSYNKITTNLLELTYSK